MRSFAPISSSFAVLAVALAAPTVASASCVAPPTGEALLASASKATAVFVGRADAGDSAFDGQLLSPITFTVNASLAGRDLGNSVQIKNGFARSGAEFVSTSIALSVRAGEQWMIDANADASGVLTASDCGPLTRRVDLDHPRTVRVAAGKPSPPAPGRLPRA